MRMRLRLPVETLMIWLMPLVVLLLFSGGMVRALPYSSGKYGACQYGSCDIILTSSGTVNLTVTPTTAGVYSTMSDDVEVETHSSTGYTLTMNDSDTNTNLVSGGNTISRTSGTQGSPVILSANTWG